MEKESGNLETQHDNFIFQASQQAGSSVGPRCFHRAAVPLLSDKLFVVSLNKREFTSHPKHAVCSSNCLLSLIVDFGLR